MARTRRLKPEGDAHFHLISRIAGRAFLLEDPRAKDTLVGTLERVAGFCGVRVCAYGIMDNHFHIVCQVRKEGTIGEETVLERIALLKGENAADALRERLAALRRDGFAESAEEELDRWRRRMDDVSEFMKLYKESFDIWYKREHPYNGSIWDGRFRSTLIESGEYLRRCVRYVEYNAIRAGIVRRARDYAWCSEGGAARGVSFALRCRANAAEDCGFTCPCEAAQGLSPREGDGGCGGTEGARAFARRRWGQVANGKIFGSQAFVARAIGAHAACFGGVTVLPRTVDGFAYASHGYLADRRREKAERNVG